MKFFSSILLAFQVIPLLIWGWIRVILRFWFIAFQFIFQKKFIFIILFFTTLLQFLSSARPWIEYTVDFVGNPETVYVSSKTNLYIILPSFINFLLINFYYTKKTNQIFLALQIFVLALYFAGLNWPSVFITDFQNPEDFQFRLVMIFFGIISGVNLLLSFWLTRAGRETTESVENRDLVS
jgi:hypothetical protein